MPNSITVAGILILGGLILLFFAIIGKVMFPRLESTLLLTPKARIGVGLLGAIAVALGLFASLSRIEPSATTPGPTPNPTVAASSPAASPSPSAPDGKITSVQSGSKVAHESIVTGTATNIPEGHRLWLVVKSGSTYYPEYGPLVLLADGTWSTPSVVTGATEDRGKSFTWNLVETGTAGTMQFTEYRKKGEATKIYGGIALADLPADAKFLHSVPVVRD
jgi:hypothetical protein